MKKNTYMEKRICVFAIFTFFISGAILVNAQMSEHIFAGTSPLFTLRADIASRTDPEFSDSTYCGQLNELIVVKAIFQHYGVSEEAVDQLFISADNNLNVALEILLESNPDFYQVIIDELRSLGIGDSQVMTEAIGSTDTSDSQCTEAIDCTTQFECTHAVLCTTGLCTIGLCTTGLCTSGLCTIGFCTVGACTSGSCTAGACTSGICTMGICETKMNCDLQHVPLQQIGHLLD